MISATLWNQLASTLSNNPTLSRYMRYVYKGRRFDFEPESLPCIMIEPVQNHEIQQDFNQIKNVYLSVDIFAFSNAHPTDFEKTIVGGQDYKGILDIENDIRACLQSSYTLGDNAIDIKINPTVFDQLDIGRYPVRGMLIPIKILYRQTDGV